MEYLELGKISANDNVLGVDVKLFIVSANVSVTNVKVTMILEVSLGTIKMARDIWSWGFLYAYDTLCIGC